MNNQGKQLMAQLYAAGELIRGQEHANHADDPLLGSNVSARTPRKHPLTGVCAILVAVDRSRGYEAYSPDEIVNPVKALV